MYKYIKNQLAVPFVAFFISIILIVSVVKYNAVDSTSKDKIENFKKYIVVWCNNSKLKNQIVLDKLSQYINKYGKDAGLKAAENEGILKDYNYVSIITDSKTINEKSKIDLTKLKSYYRANNFKDKYTNSFFESNNNISYVSSAKIDDSNNIIAVGELINNQDEMKDFSGINISDTEKSYSYSFLGLEGQPVGYAIAGKDQSVMTGFTVTMIIIVLLALIMFLFVIDKLNKDIETPINDITEYVEEYNKSGMVLHINEPKYEFARLYFSLEAIFNTQNDAKRSHKEQLNAANKINTKLTYQERILSVIFHISTEIAKGTNLDDMLQEILNKTVDLIPNAQKGMVLLLDDQQEGVYDMDKEMSFKALAGYNDNLKRVSIKGKENFIYRQYDPHKPFIAKHGEHFGKFLINDERARIIWSSEFQEVQSTLIAPIMVKGKIHGVIYLDSVESENAFNEDSIQLINYLSVQLSIAVEHALLVNKIVYLSKYDNLTATYNRTYFKELFNNNFLRAKRYNETFCLVSFDIKGLNKINIRYGTHIGDRALMLVANIIKEHVRKTDFCGRVGADEFNVILINTKKEDAIKKANDIKETIQNAAISTGTTDIHIEINLGYVYYPDDSDNAESIFILANSRTNR